MGWTLDPVSVPSNYDAAVESGGAQFTVTRSGRWMKIPSSGWKYFLHDSDDSAFANTRNETHGVLYAYASAESVAANAVGTLQFEVVWGLRGIVDRASPSAALTLRNSIVADHQARRQQFDAQQIHKTNSLEERKSDGDDDSPGVLVGPARPLNVRRLAVSVPAKLPVTTPKKLLQ